MSVRSWEVHAIKTVTICLSLVMSSSLHAADSCNPENVDAFDAANIVRFGHLLFLTPNQQIATYRNMEGGCGTEYSRRKRAIVIGRGNIAIAQCQLPTWPEIVRRRWFHD